MGEVTWEISDPQFSSDEICLGIAESVWSGHRNFAYDLVRFVRPRLIVELGVHWGTSFFAFCQAVKDGNLSTRCIAVDTWSGDAHAGFYGEEVFEHFQKIRSQYYATVDIVPLRMTFSDAVASVKDDSVDILHIDGYHMYEAVSGDFSQWLSKVAPNGVVLFHDVAESAEFGASRFWKELRQEYPSFEFRHSFGLGVLFPNGQEWFQAMQKESIEDKIPQYEHKAGIQQAEDTRALERQLMASKTELNAHAEEITALRAEIERAHIVRGDLERRISDAQTQQTHHEAKTAEKDVHIQNLEAMLSAIYGSKGWRVLSEYRHVKYNILLLSLRSIRRLIPARLRSRIRTVIPKAFITPFAKCSPAPASAPTWQPDLYSQWLVSHEVRPDRSEARKLIAQMSSHPKISIVMPTYNPAADHLRAAIESVLQQYYDNWELCIVDDASTVPHVRRILERFIAQDDRIRVEFREHNGGIGHASNVALSHTTGEYIALLDHDDTLSDNSLLEVAKLLNAYPDTDMIYSDEDKLDENDRRCNPFFKPDWSPTTFLSYMYTCHLGVYRKSLLDKIGGFREGYDGSQDYDLVLRLTEHTSKIRHIAKVLYHWRMTAQSTAKDASNKSYAEGSACKALMDAMSRRGQKVSGVEIGRLPTTYRVRYVIPIATTVHIIIPSRNNVRYLQRCVSSIIDKTQYSHYSIYIIDNGSDDPRTLQYLDEIRGRPQIRVLHYDQPFNYSSINNWAISQIDGQYLLLLNDDTEVIDGCWLEAMLEHARRPEVGAVGAKLIYPDGRIQHAGVILGIGGIAGHSHKYFPSDHGGYLSRLQVVQNLSAVTAACMLTRREVFDQVGGLNEKDLAVAFNDVDYCLKVRDAGYQIVYTPFAELYHHESASRGFHINDDEVAYMQKKWRKHLQRDPFYNPNLTLKREDFSLCP